MTCQNTGFHQFNLLPLEPVFIQRQLRSMVARYSARPGHGEALSDPCLSCQQSKLDHGSWLVLFG